MPSSKQSRSTASVSRSKTAQTPVSAKDGRHTRRAQASPAFVEARDVAKAGAAPQAIGEPVRFTPRQELWAREGSAEKWLEERSAYYFAESLLQDVRLEEVPGARFTFYLDETEPLNSEDPMMSPNPEVVCCYFDAAVGGEVS